MVRTIPLLLLLALPAAQPRVAPVHTAKIVDASRQAGVIQTLPPREAAAAIEAAHRLLPDRRFLLAVSDVYALRTGRSAPAEVRFASNVWEVTCDGKRAGTLPLLPTFSDALTLLTAWAHSVPVANPAKTAGDANADRLIAAFDRHSLFQEMQLIPEAPIDGVAAARAARAAVYLNLQLTDAFELADRLRARALALLAIARSDDARFGQEETALLASTLRYDVEARTLAAQLPAGSASQVLTGLSSPTPAMLEGAPLLAHVAAARLIQSGGNDRAIQAFGNRMPGVALPVLLEVYDFGRRVQAASSVQQTLAADVAGSSAANGGQTPIAAFEKSLDTYSREYSSPLLDSSLIRLFEQALFYSAVDQEYAFHLSQRGDRATAEAFVKSLGESTEQPGHDVRAVLAATNDVTWNAARGVNPSLPATLTHVGAGTRARLLMRANDAARRSTSIEATPMCAELDSRPAQLTIAAQLAARFTLDPARRDLWYGALLERAPDMPGGGQRAWFYKVTGNVAGLRQIASDRRFSSDDRAVAISYLSTAGDADFAVTEFAKLMEETNYASYAAYAAFLNERRDWKRKEAAARRGVELAANGHPITRAYYAFSLADALEEQGRYDEAWQVVDPHIPTWSANIIAAAVSLLERRAEIAESDELARQYIERYPGAAARSTYAVVLWRQSRWDDAASLFNPATSALSEAEWTQWMPQAFERHVRDSQTALAAFEALQRAGVSPAMLIAIPRHLTAKHPAMAVALMETMRAPERQYDEFAAASDITEFEARLASGDAAAITWLRAQTPDENVAQVVLVLLQSGRYDAALGVAGDRPTLKNTDELRLYLAIALIGARAAADDPRLVALRRELEAIPANMNAGSPQAAARFALGLIDEAAASKWATSPISRSVIDYIIGLRLAAGGNYNAALPHVLAASQRSGEGSTPQSFAIDLLTRWLSASASWPEVARRGIL